MQKSPLKLFTTLIITLSLGLTGCSAQDFLSESPSLLPPELIEESTTNKPNLNDPSNTPTVPLTPTLQLFTSAGTYTTLGTEIFLSTNPEIVNAVNLKSKCTNLNVTSEANVLGCFITPPGKIFLYGITDPRVSNAGVVIASHEMLHAVWQTKLSTAERAELTRLLEKHYNSLPPGHYLRERLTLYAEKPESIPAELHSILGTEAPNLSVELEVHYQKYFSNRATLVKLADDSFGYVDRLTVEVKETSKALEAQRSINEINKIKLEEQNRILNNDVATFNQQVSDGLYSNKSEYDKVKNNLDNRRKILDEGYRIFNSQITLFNSLIIEYNDLVKLSNELNAALNSATK